MLRVNWYPWLGSSFTVGFSFPLGQRWIGRSRPRDTEVRVAERRPKPIPYDIREPAIDEAMANVRESARWIARFTVPFIDQDGRDNQEAMARFSAYVEQLKIRLDQRSFEDEIRRYHRELARTFSIAASGTALPEGRSTPRGEQIAARAKQILLDEVIFPYNRLLGQRKKNDTVLELGLAARGLFARWVVNSSVVPEQRIDPVLYVFQELLGVAEEARASVREEWNDPRLVWIPLQYGLRPEQHDTQTELDAIVERALGRKFTDGNRVWYLRNVQFQWELWRMIHEAEDYQVLWVHDFRGYDSPGVPDSIAAWHVVQSYLSAMTERVERYDEDGKFPVYMIFLDQHYYEINKARLWMDLLENPLEHELDLPDGFEGMARAVADAQSRLRAAVANSALLQAEARQYGEDWLRNRIKVHVNITQPADLTFWSKQGLSALFGYPDNIMRDHRKIAFYDITEDGPYKGMAIYTGMGVGKHYTGPEWDDRSILARGPAVLDLKYAARTLLLDNGMPESQLPYPLRVRPKPENYDEIVRDTVAASLYSARALELHNQVGYGVKPVNVLKATLYTLMPPGSVLKVPDSLWNSPFLAALLIGSCLRGAQVYMIAPALENAPSSGSPQMSRAYELFERLVVLQDLLGPEIAAAGGKLRTGLYNLDVDVRDFRGRMEAWLRGVRANPEIQELFGFGPATYESIEELVAGLPAYAEPTDSVIQPKLHGKVHFFASDEGWSRLLSRPEWQEMWSLLIADGAERGGVLDTYRDPRVRPAEMNEIVERMFAALDRERTPEERERVIYYLTVGSANQDYRSMLMDGEVAFVVSGYEALTALLDMLFLAGTATWIDDIETLNRLLPPYSEFERRIGRAIKEAL